MIVLLQMQIEDQQPCSWGIQTMLKDNNNRERLIKMILHSFKVMGWNQSVRQLQQESGITSGQDQLNQLKTLLDARNYAKTAEHINTLPLALPLKQDLQQQLGELAIMDKIKQEDYEQAVQLIAETKLPEEKQLKYLAMVGLGFSQQDEELYQQKKHLLLDKCMRDTVQMVGLENLLKNYLGKDVQTRLARPTAPPKQIVARSSSAPTHLKGIIIKFNTAQTRIVLVGQSSLGSEVILYEVKNSQVVRLGGNRAEGIGSLTTVKWNTNVEKEQIGVCGSEELVIYNAPSVQFVYRIKRSDHSLPRLLTFQWQPVSQLLYLGGLFEQLRIFSSDGQPVGVIAPFVKTRELVLGRQGQAFAISATKSQLVRFCLSEEKVVNNWTNIHPFMDLKYYPAQNWILTTTRQLIYLLNAESLAIVQCFDAPSNPRLYQIQAFCYANWLVVFNGPLSATYQNQRLTRHAHWPDADAIDVGSHRMATLSANTSIVIWQSNNNDEIQDSQVEQDSSESDQDESIEQMDHFYVNALELQDDSGSMEDI